MMHVKQLLSVVILVLVLIPAAALAADHEVTGGTFDLSTCAAGDTVTVKSGATATLTGAVPTGVYVPVSCEAGVTLTLNGREHRQLHIQRYLRAQLHRHRE